MTEVDVFIAGGGIAGLAAAARLSEAGISVMLADPAPVALDGGEDGADLRSTAFLQPARDLFETCGLWEALAPRATPLEILRVLDTRGQPPEIVTDRAFRADDLGEATFGWNLPNWLTRKVLADALGRAPGVELRFGVGVMGLLTRSTEARVTLSDGTRVAARLVIAADGRASTLREAAGITVRQWRYGQKALAFAVAHDLPHENISTELYLSGGAFTLVPLPDHQGRPASAVVWMDDGPDSLRRAALDAPALGREATERSCGILGALAPISRVAVFPVVTQIADSLIAERTALIAEAAHVMPPIGAQGLNTSLQDVAALGHLAETRAGEIGTPAFLDAYARARGRDLAARARVIDAFNRLCRSGAPVFQDMRSRGLALIHDFRPLRETVMKAGLGG